MAKTGGRVAGTPNKISGAVRDNVVNVFNKIGGEDEMARWAKKNPTEFYRLYSKLLPRQVNSEISTDSNQQPEQLSDDELTAIIRDRQSNNLKAV